MIKSLLKLLVVLVIGILIYNLFLGTDEEKQGAKKIVGEVKDVGVAVKDLLKAEKEKFDKGKYDKAVDKVGDMLQGLKRNAKEFDEKYLVRIEKLEDKRRELQKDLAEYDETSSSKPNDGSNDSSAIKEDLQKLLKETESLINDMESGN
ncbi:MAG: hypothetical protein HY842_00850 [Bacteroidetes bacterium]|nr:hypothetical protein [Bacteroidota bacterium]